MQKEEFPLILSPNLGCPRIIGEHEIEHGIEIIIAGQYGMVVHPTKETFKNCLKLVPSYPDNLCDIPLDVEYIEELTDWNQLDSFLCTGKLEKTQQLINSEIHYKLLGEETKYWLLKVEPVINGNIGSIFRKKYLFNWDDLPKNDTEKLKKFLNDEFGIEWVKNAKIEKINDGKTIIIYTEKNILSLELNDEKTRVHLKIKDVRTEEIIAEMEKGKLNIYQKINLPTLYDLVLCDDQKFEKRNYHAVQFVKTSENSLNFIHLTDLHLSQRNDDILAEVLKKDKNEDKSNWVVRQILKLFSIEKKQNIRSREDIEKSYINFNDNFRKFVEKANKMVDDDKLDFIVITGDIVDFVNPGWDEEIRLAENSWRIFLDIVTGKGSDINLGLKIAVFTSTGNHDWRLHPGGMLPYICGMDGECKKFGITEDEAKNYNYRSFDSLEYPEDEREKLSKALQNEALERLNFDVFKGGFLKIARLLGWMQSNFWVASIISILSGTALFEALTLDLNALNFTNILNNTLSPGFFIVMVVFAVLPALINMFARKNLKKVTDLLVDNPVHAEVKGLHYYFLHINPYFDYAFSFGNNHFVIMDTGADVFTIPTKELMDGEFKHLKIGSFDDNVLGSSPDSMAFDDRQAYYNWSQIVWLDKVLVAASRIKRDNEKKGSIFICVHAPPVNYDINKPLDNLRELELFKYDTKTYVEEDEYSYYSLLHKVFSYIPRKIIRILRQIIGLVFPKYKPREQRNLTYGTINHFLSQFFFLCLGYHENPHRRIKPNEKKSDLEKVDIVFSGHAHINVEFRLGLDTIVNKSKTENKIRIYHDHYSQIPMDFEAKKPFIVQTAACGPETEELIKKKGVINKIKNWFIYKFISCYINRLFFWRQAINEPVQKKSPYWRRVEVDKDNHVISFKQEHS